MDTSIPAGTCIVGTHKGTRRAHVSYLSNKAWTGIILSVPMGTNWHPYLLSFSLACWFLHPTLLSITTINFNLQLYDCFVLNLEFHDISHPSRPPFDALITSNHCFRRRRLFYSPPPFDQSTLSSAKDVVVNYNDNTFATNSVETFVWKVTVDGHASILSNLQ